MPFLLFVSPSLHEQGWGIVRAGTEPPIGRVFVAAN